MSQPTNGNLTASYFRTVLDEETKKLKVLCQEWETFLAAVTDPEALSEEDGGQIRSAIGQANLLIDKRFKQFSGLIKNCEDQSTPKVTTEDLQGFWEMMYFQVEDVHSRFKQLVPLKNQSSSV